jgi:hypothetical protein
VMTKTKQTIKIRFDMGFAPSPKSKFLFHRDIPDF